MLSREALSCPFTTNYAHLRPSVIDSYRKAGLTEFNLEQVGTSGRVPARFEVTDGDDLGIMREYNVPRCC